MSLRMIRETTVGEHDGYTLGLVEDLGRIALDQSAGATILFDCEYAGEHRTDRAADRMNAESVKLNMCLSPLQPQ